MLSRVIKKELEEKGRKKKKDAQDEAKRKRKKGAEQDKPDDAIFVDKHRAAAVGKWLTVF